MQLPQPATLVLEKAIESVLRLDPDTREKLQALDGKRIRVLVDSPDVDLLLSFDQGKIFVNAGNVAGNSEAIHDEINNLWQMPLLAAHCRIYCRSCVVTMRCIPEMCV